MRQPMMKLKSASVILVMIVLGLAGCQQPSAWRQDLSRQLPKLGDRNWIVIADAAYPWQTSPGITTVCTGANQLDVAKRVLQAIDATPHVRATIFADSELKYVSPNDAPGIEAYLKARRKLLADRNVTAQPHLDSIHQLAAAGKLYHILLLKTNLTLPYTTLFIRLDCGYWSAAAEKRLRSAIQAAGEERK